MAQPVRDRFFQGDRSVVVVPDLRWALGNGSDPQGIRFDVDAGGNVTATNATQAIGSGSTLSFENRVLNIDVGAFAGQYAAGFLGPGI